MKDITVQKVKKLKGEIIIPGDKSISHRAIMLGSLAKGKTKIKGFLHSEDCLNTMGCFRDMGINFDIKDKDIVVEGKGLFGLQAPAKQIYAGNSGTTIRLIIGILSAQKFVSSITGDETLCRRPMDRVMIPLKQMGSCIEAAQGRYAPLKITGSNLKAICYELPVASAQVKSSILLAGLYAQGKTEVIEKVQTRDHTERMMQSFGVDIKKINDTITLEHTEDLKAREIEVPGDISSAAFFIVAGLITPNSHIVIKNVGMNPTRNKVIDVLVSMGGNINIINKRSYGQEPVADLEVRHSVLKGIKIGGDVIANIIDEIPVLCVAASFAQGITEISNAKELRVKESDRIKTMVEALLSVGVDIKEKEDGMIIHGAEIIRGGKIKTYYDHRVAMALSIAGLNSQDGIFIDDIDCVATSFPNFYELIKKLKVF